LALLLGTFFGLFRAIFSAFVLFWLLAFSLEDISLRHFQTSIERMAATKKSI
jgi:hypothetical protein